MTAVRGVKLLPGILLACILMLTACGATTGSPNGGRDSPNSPKGESPSPGTQQARPNEIDLDEIAALPAVPLHYEPEAAGSSVQSSADGEIDYSNMSNGYVMVKYTGEPTGNITDVRVGIITPNGERGMYHDSLPQDGLFHVFSLTEGDGIYVVSIFKRKEGDFYNQLLAAELDVAIDDEFKPFLIPHQKIVFSSDSLSVKLAAELTGSSDDVIRSVEVVFNYVIGNIKYDKDKAQAAANGELQAYIPDNDQVLRQRRGICYDYATLTTAMLRSVGIPSKMIFGFASVGDGSEPVYHAWISVYSAETGWINKIIEFRSGEWIRMDPTFSSSANDKTMARFIGDGNNYADVFLY